MTNSLENPAPQVKVRGKGLISRFKKDSSGSVAIEFSMLAIPFAMLVFAIIEVCVSFTEQQVMANVTDDVSRLMRTGQMKTADATPAAVRTKICNALQFMAPAGCPGLDIDLKEYASYGAVPTTIPYLPSGDINTSGFTVALGGATTINHLRVFYRWPVITDLMSSYMSGLPGKKMLLYSSATWRVEPYL
jgi:Flp pilus assembly protein TadG